ncbi:uncharacterized protein LOC144589338 isoform X2 [Pogona vitticeps]
MWQCLLGHPIRSMGSVWHLGTFNGIMRRICSNSALLSLPFTPVLEEILNVISSDLMKTRCLNSNKGAAKVEEARREKKSSCWYLSAKQSIEFCAVKLELTYCAPNNAFKFLQAMSFGFFPCQTDAGYVQYLIFAQKHVTIYRSYHMQPTKEINSNKLPSKKERDRTLSRKSFLQSMDRVPTAVL